ncbi:hypothetical protein DUI87_19144 [Hirundo rustica rustica]|uniref:Peptidase A2 domain-containing protein n=1 Tax=Hirundo rustica rustica TaxID=333673 RepID=A0A3M0JUC5_HIRRU|nr:hypothetical protein DUI87_19144 [Hirundo rustica rustica]
MGAVSIEELTGTLPLAASMPCAPSTEGFKKTQKNQGDRVDLAGRERRGKENVNHRTTPPHPTKVGETESLPDLTPDKDHELAKPILTTDSSYKPHRLQLTESLLLNEDDWQFAAVDPSEPGTWPQIEGKFIIVGDCKYTPREVEVLLGTLTTNPGDFILWLCCTHSPTFLPKGQIVAQAIPILDPSPENTPSACPVQKITECKPKVDYEFSVGGEALNITGLLDMGADVTIVPTWYWPSHWALQNVAGHVQGVGSIQLAKQPKSVVQIREPKGQLASLHPFVLDYKEPCLGEISWPSWGVTIDIPDPSQDFWAAATEKRPTQKLNLKTDTPVWVEQWPLSKQKLKALHELMEEQLKKGNIEETTSPWNSPVFVIQKADKNKWRLLHDLRQIDNVMVRAAGEQSSKDATLAVPGTRNKQVDHCAAKIGHQNKIRTLADVHQLCGVLNWVRPWLGLTTEDLAPLFELLKGGEELSSPRVLTPEAKKALEKVLNPQIIRHFGASEQLTMKERPPVMVKDPETGRTEGPHELVMLGRGYTCIIYNITPSPSVNHTTIQSAPEEDMELEEGLDIEGQDNEGWPTQQEWFAESYPGPEHFPPPAQVSAFLK